MSSTFERWIGAVGCGMTVSGILAFGASLCDLPFQPRMPLGDYVLVFDQQVAFWAGFIAAAIGSSIAFGVYLSQRAEW